VRIAKEQQSWRKDPTWRTAAEQECHALVDKLTPKLTEFQNALHARLSKENYEDQRTLSCMLQRIKQAFEYSTNRALDSRPWSELDRELCAALEGNATLAQLLQSLCVMLESRVQQASHDSDTDSSDVLKRSPSVPWQNKAALMCKAIVSSRFLYEVSIEDPEFQGLAAGLQCMGQQMHPSTVSSCDNISAAISGASDGKRSYQTRKRERGELRFNRKMAAEPGDILDLEGRKFDFKTIIVNFANLGNYGRREDKYAKFSWSYVFAALESLLKDDYIVYGVIQENFRGGVPEDISRMLGGDNYIINVPRQRVKAGEKDDLDDQATIEAAYNRCCRLLDNDMYRDWMYGKLQDMQVQKWLRHHYSIVKLGYYFDGYTFRITRHAKVDVQDLECGRDGFA